MRNVISIAEKRCFAVSSERTASDGTKDAAHRSSFMRKRYRMLFRALALVIAVCCSLVFVPQAWAAWTTSDTVASLAVGAYPESYVWMKTLSCTGSPNGTSFVVPTTHVAYHEMVSTLLAAQLSGRKVQLGYNPASCLIYSVRLMP